MVIDASALIAILLDEPEADSFVEKIMAADTRVVGAPTIVEAAAVMLARSGPAGEIALDALLQRLGIAVIEMSPEAAGFSRSAYARYGKGVSAPGILNYDDCLAYGVAKSLDEPLLFKGDDFAQTDVDVA